MSVVPARLTETRWLPTRRRVGRALILAATLGSSLVLLIDFVIAPLTGHFSGQFEDFSRILYAGHAANLGMDPYGAFVPLASTTLATNLGFCYMPLIAVLARPLAALPAPVATTLWLWFGLACLVTATVITARTVLPHGWPREAIAVSMIVVFPPLTYNLWHGNLNIVVLLSLAVALRSWIRGDELSCGFALAVGGIAKIAPLALLLLLLRRRWWRGFAVGAATWLAALLLGGLLLGFNRLAEWLTQVLPALGRADGSFINQGLGAVISRLADHNVWRLDPTAPALQLVVTLASAACVLAVVWVVHSGPATPERRAVEFAAGIVAMVLAGTVAWWSDYGSVALALMVVIGMAGRLPLTRWVMGAGLVAYVGAGLVASILFGFGGETWLPSTHGTPLWELALQVDSVSGYATLGLLAALVITLARDPGRARGDRGRMATAVD